MAKTIRFEVQSIIDGPRPFVIVRGLEPASFTVTERATLGGAPVRSFELPRAVDAAGKPRMDLFGFSLVRREDLSRFTVGQRLELDPG